MTKEIVNQHNDKTDSNKGMKTSTILPSALEVKVKSMPSTLIPHDEHTSLPVTKQNECENDLTPSLEP